MLRDGSHVPRATCVQHRGPTCPLFFSVPAVTSDSGVRLQWSFKSRVIISQVNVEILKSIIQQFSDVRHA